MVGIFGFRKSIMGFNRDDVTQYIDKLEAKFISREKELNEKINSLNQINFQINHELEDSNNQLYEVINMNNKLKDELVDYKLKQAEIERLSESIGKLYLVAQANAQTIIDNAKANSAASREEVAKNIEGIENAQSNLDVLKNRLSESTAKFSDEIESIFASLNQTKQFIDEKSEEIESAEQTLDNLIGSVNVEVNA